MRFSISLTPLSFLLLILIASSCANYKLNYADEGWKQKVAPSDEQIKQRIYLIGDCGNADYDSLQKAVFLLKPALAENPVPDKNTSVIFLGDNLYPVGLAPEDHPDRTLGEVRLGTQVYSVKNFQGLIRMIPGNHDWFEYGREGLIRQEQFIESRIKDDHPYHTNHDYFQPSNGCGDIEVSRIGDLNIVAIDSHWWLESFNSPYDWSNCDIQDKLEFNQRFRETFEELKGQEVLLTMHHPTHTMGKHNGNFRFKQVVFPSSDWKNFLYIPLPVSGYIYSKMRAYVSPQDNKNARNKGLQKLTTEVASKHGKTIIAAGHEHTLQYFYIDNLNFIVSGAGSKKSAVAMGPGSEFAYGHYGFAVLDYYKDGSRWVKFYAPDENSYKLKEVFRKPLSYITELPKKSK